MQSYYWWKKFSPSRLRRSFSRPPSEGSHEELNPEVKFDPEQVKLAHLPSEKSFIRTYGVWLALCVICGVTCVVLFWGAFASMLFWNAGFLLYFIPLAMGVVLAILLPFVWYRRFNRMRALGGSILQEPDAEKTEPCTEQRWYEGPTIESQAEKSIRRQLIFLGAVAIVFAVFGCLLGAEGLYDVLTMRYSGNAPMIALGGLVFVVMLTTAAASVSLGEGPIAKNLGILSAAIAVLCLFFDAILLVSDAKQMLGLGHSFLLLTGCHAVYLFSMTLRTRLL